MTLIKSLLLGSAAGIVAVASAQAADLPTKKAAPVEYVKVCNVGGITGWTLPGSDTCVKFSGYVTAQFVGGTLNTEYNFGSLSSLNGVTSAVTGLPVVNPLTGMSTTVTPFTDTQKTQRVLIAASDAQGNTTFYRNETGWTVRANFGFDMASNTAYGPLIGHFDLNSDLGNGLESLIGNGTNQVYINTAYLTWAGITAGKAQSFYSFTGGGDNWANFFSPDQKGFNEPLLMAYTASFGGGFTATLAAQSPGGNGDSGYGTDTTTASIFDSNTGLYTPTANNLVGGQRWPDFVGALHVKQGWGEAQVSGVIHDVAVRDAIYGTGTAASLTCGLDGDLVCNGGHNQIGWGVDAGVKINLPSFGAGDDALVTGSYTQSAFWYSGIPDGMWGEFGQVNGNGQPMFGSDAYFNPLTNQWSKPTAWTVSALIEHHFTPQFYIDLEGSVGQVKWSNMGGGCYIYGFGCGALQAIQGPLSPTATSWIVGADLGWNPVTNLNFDLELMYQSTNQAQPSGFAGTVYNFGQPNEFFVPGDWHGVSQGFEGKLRITRYF
jgi:Porin subfamily